MTSSEWLNEKFNGDDESFSATDTVTASVSLFLTWFGTAIQSVLDNSTSIYNALTATNVEQRGWTPIFDAWKSQGIIS